jgi:hypothetical protein
VKSLGSEASKYVVNTLKTEGGDAKEEKKEETKKDEKKAS